MSRKCSSMTSFARSSNTCAPIRLSGRTIRRSMSFRIPLAVGLLVGFVTSAAAQAPLRLQISDGRVTLHAENVPIRTILAEWARVGGTTILTGDGIAGAPLTLELAGVP